MSRVRAIVAVLGDLGRSPRMLYHARALADSGVEVDLIGYVERDVPPDVAQDPRIRVSVLASPVGRARHRLPRPIFLAVALWNAARQAGALLVALVRRTRRGDVILVQTPPAVPTLLTALVAARLRGARLVVDWHNLGWAMLALRLGERHPVVRLARASEPLIGRQADAHLCVSHALAAELACRGVGAVTVLYDRPAAVFAPTGREARRLLLRRLADHLRLPDLATTAGERVALIVSPTSWTADEDFALLVEAAVRLDEKIAREEAASFPPVAIVVTGDGPLRAEYERRFAELRLERVHLRTLWLSAADYPLFIGAADVGLCLHRSASGLDLPMKIADLFGARVPVVAFDYGPCLAELVRDDENGLLFRSADQLVDCLRRLLRGFPDDTALLDRLRAGTERGPHERWADAWTAVAKPVLLPAGVP